MPMKIAVLLLSVLAMTLMATGQPDCSDVVCAAVFCPDPVTPPGQCCPVCRPDPVLCATPLCANPVTPPGENCPSCENSGCQFEGCVNFLPDGSATWAPSPCFHCQCSNNETICAIIDCLTLTEEDCFGNPVIIPPGECCPRCDFGTPTNTCETVPLPRSFGGIRNITVSDGSTSCSKEVTLHTCNIRGFRQNDEIYACRPRESKRCVRFGRECPLRRGFYQDVVRCRAVRDETKLIGCALLVE